MMGVYEEGIGARSALGTRSVASATDRSPAPRWVVGAVGRTRSRPSACSTSGFLLVWHGLRFTPVGEWPPFEVADIFGLALFGPLPLLMLLSLLCASRRAGLVLLAPVLLLAVTYGPLFLPRPSPPSSDRAARQAAPRCA